MWAGITFLWIVREVILVLFSCYEIRNRICMICRHDNICWNGPRRSSSRVGEGESSSRRHSAIEETTTGEEGTATGDGGRLAVSEWLREIWRSHRIPSQLQHDGWLRRLSISSWTRIRVGAAGLVCLEEGTILCRSFCVILFLNAQSLRNALIVGGTAWARRPHGLVCMVTGLHPEVQEVHPMLGLGSAVEVTAAPQVTGVPDLLSRLCLLEDFTLLTTTMKTTQTFLRLDLRIAFQAARPFKDH